MKFLLKDPKLELQKNDGKNLYFQTEQVRVACSYQAQKILFKKP